MRVFVWYGEHVIPSGTMISAHPFRLCAVLQDVSCKTDRLKVAYLVLDHVPGVFGGYGINARLPEGELWVVPG